MASIQVQDLRKTFGALAAVDGISLNIADGEFVALLGPSGCGADGCGSDMGLFPVNAAVPASRAVWWIGGSSLIFVLAAVCLPLVGPSPLDFEKVRAGLEPDWSILVDLRVSRTWLGLLAGGALALAGAVFQSMLRDALATPYTLGVSTGASLGAVLAIAFGWPVVLGMPGVWGGALLGAGAVLLIVVGASRHHRDISTFGLLLAGIATNSVCTAMILLVYSFAGMSESFAISRWLIGGLDAIDYPSLTLYAALVVVSAVVLSRQARNWNLLAVGEAWASTRGARRPT